MECSHTVGIDICTEGCVLINIRTDIIARKEHTCFECHKVIEKGERYTKEVVKDRNKYCVYKTCDDCYSIRQVFFSDGWYWTKILEHMDEFVNDCGGDVSNSCLMQLTPRARDMVCDMIEETWEYLYG